MYARDEARIATPIGIVHLIGDDTLLHRVRIDTDDAATVSRGTAAVTRAAANQIEAWFAGDRQGFDLPLAPAETQRGAALRSAVMEIPFGITVSYGQLANRAGSSARTVGQACARNPLPLIAPCHRVLGTGGALGHYSAGNGARTKTWLLDHERKFAKGDLLL